MIFPVFVYISLCVAFLLPNHYYPWGSFYLEFAAFIALFLSLIDLLIKKMTVRPRIPVLFFLALSLVPAFQWLFGVVLFAGDALLAFFYLGSFSLAMMVAHAYGSEDSQKRMIESIALALVFVGIISTWVAIIQWLRLWETPWIHSLPIGARPYANLGQPNNYSSLMWVAAFSLCFLFERKRIGIFGFLVAGCFLVGGAALAQSRTSWVVLTVLLVVGIIHWMIFERRAWRRVVLLICAMGVFYALSIGSAELKGFLFGGEIQSLRSQFTDIRTDMWVSFVHAIIERPWFGYGWGQISLAQFEVAEMYPAVGLTQYSHNLFLDLLIWNGVPIGLLFISLISFFWLRMFFYAYSDIGFYSLCCFSALFIHGLLEYPHAYSYFLLLAGFFIGVSAFESIDCNQFRNIDGKFRILVGVLNRTITKRYLISNYVLILCVLLFSVFLAVSWRDYRLLEEDHRLLRFETASIGTLKAEQKAPDVFIFDQLQSFTWVARTDSFDGLTENEQQRLENVAMRYALPMPLYKLAQLRVAQDRPDDAEKTLKTIGYLYGEDSYNSAKEALSKYVVRDTGVD